MPPQNVFPAESSTISLILRCSPRVVDSAGQLAEHALVQQVVVGAIEREPRDFAIDVHLEELKFFDLGRNQRQRAEDFDACAARRLMHGHEIAPVYALADRERC